MVMYQVNVERPAHPAIIELHADLDAVAACERAIDCRLDQAGVRVHTAGAITTYRIEPDTWLILAPQDRESALAQSLDDALGNDHAAFSIVTDAYVSFRLSGLDAREVLCQAVAIDLDPSVFGPGSVARCAFAKSSAVVHCKHDDRTRDAGVLATAGNGQPKGDSNTPAAGLVYDIYIESPHEQYAVAWFTANAGQSAVENLPD